MIADRRAVLTGAAALALPTSVRADIPLSLDGRMVQGGHVIGRTAPGALVYVDGEALAMASADGWFFVGFDRDAPLQTAIVVRRGRDQARQTLTLARGRFRSTRVDGLPPATVAPNDPALLAQIEREVALKTEAFASRIDGDDFRTGFRWPLDPVRVTSSWGAQRVLNGTPARPHYGIDLGAAAGTPIRAPAGGRVVLAQAGLHFEGGLTLIDHGQGVISAYLHQSRIDVESGQAVRAGDVLGRVGSTGRATGPHLCWRLKWRGRNLDPSLLTPG